MLSSGCFVSTSSARFTGRAVWIFFQEINLHGQLTNLGMESLPFLFKILFPSAFAAFEHAGDIFRQHFLPLRDLRGMNIVFLRDLVDRFLFLHGLKGHSRLEGAIVSSAFGFHFNGWLWFIDLLQPPLFIA